VNETLLKLPSGKRVIDHWDDGLSIVWAEENRTCQAKLEGTDLELFAEVQRLQKIVAQIDTAPLYYVLRRTVGKTTLHYEYFTRQDFKHFEFDSQIGEAFLFTGYAPTVMLKDLKEAGFDNVEIITVRLLVGGVE